MSHTIQRAARWAAVVAGFACLAALIMDPHPLTFAGVLVAALGVYAASREMDTTTLPVPKYGMQRQQILAVLKNHYVDPLLAGRATDSQVETMLAQFDQASGRLLITGEHGSGKTTAALCLMRGLIRRAEQDDSQPIPLLLSVAQWTHDQDELIEWVQREAARHYAIPQKITLHWLIKDRLILVLDDFDDLPPDFQAAFVGLMDMLQDEYTPFVCCASYGAHTLSLNATFDSGRTRAGAAANPDSIPRPLSLWLSEIASQMTRSKQHTFFIEDLNRDWLMPKQRIWAGLWARTGILLFTVIIMAVGLTVALSFAGSPRSGSRNLTDTLESGVLFGVFWGAMLVFFMGGADISPKAYEPGRLSLSNMRYGSYFMLWGGFTFAPAIGLLFGILPALCFDFSSGVKFGVTAALMLGLGQTAIQILGTISAPGTIETNPRPNMHVGYALNQAFMLLPRTVVLSGGALGLFIALRTDEIGTGIGSGLMLGLVFGTAISLGGGGIALIRHVITRLMLYRAGRLPLNMADFLNEVVAQGVMVAVGSGFQFRDKAALAVFAEAASELPAASPTPDTGDGWHVPYSVEVCRERISDAVTEASRATRGEFGGLAVRFTQSAAGDWDFDIVTGHSNNNGTSFTVTGTLSAREQDTTQVTIKARATAEYWFILLGGIGLGVLFSGYGILTPSEPFAVMCALPVGILMLFIELLIWANSPESVHKLQGLVFDALEIPHETHLAPWRSTAASVGVVGIFFAIVWGLSSFGAGLVRSALPTTQWTGLVVAIGVFLFILYSFAAAFAAGFVIYLACGRTRHTLALRIVTVLKWLNPLMVALSRHYTLLEAEVLFRAGRYDEADAAARICLMSKRILDKASPQEFGLITLGSVQLARGNYPLAKEYLEKARSQGIQTHSMYLVLSQCYLLEGEAAQALELLDLARQRPWGWISHRAPEYLPSHLHATYAWAYAQQNRAEDARESLAAALRPTGESYRPGEAELHYWAAHVERQLGNNASARAHLQQAIDLDPHGHAGTVARQFLATLV